MGHKADRVGHKSRRGDTMRKAALIIIMLLLLSTIASASYDVLYRRSESPRKITVLHSDVTATGYMGTKSLLLAMKKAGSDSDLKAIDKAYFQVDWVTPMGWKFELDKEGWLVWRELSISQVKDAKVQIVKKIPRF